MSGNEKDDKPISNPSDLKNFIVGELEKSIFLITNSLFNKQFVDAFWGIYYLFPNLPPDILEKPTIVKREREVDLILKEAGKAAAATGALGDYTAHKASVQVLANHYPWVRACIRDIQKELYNYMRTGYRGVDLDKTLGGDEDDRSEE